MPSIRPVTLALLTALYASLCLALPAEAQPDTTRWTPELSMQYKQITDTEISPDGGHVAYVVREAVMDEETSEYRQHLHVAASDGASDRQYTYGEHSNWSPKWSPDGRRIAFLSTRAEGPPQVYLMRLQGGEASQVTDAETGVSGFEWGPDGERIAFTMADPKSEAERRREREKRDVEIVGEEHRNDHLYVTEVRPAKDTTRQVQRLTAGDFHVTGFDWAPSVETIAFAHRPNSRANSYLETDLSTVPADSGEVETLVERPGRDANPHYSPDGRAVAFVSGSGERAWEGLGDVYTVPAEGGAPTALPQTPNRDVGVLGLSSGLIGWTAGGEALLVVDVEGTSTQVFAVPTEGASVKQITSREGRHGPFPLHAPTYSRSADRMAFTYQNSTTPPEVYVSPREGADRRKITGVHEEVPQPEMGRTELVTWEGEEGREIEGLLTYPVGYEEEDQVPLVVDVHGGPAYAHLRSFTGALSIYHFYPSQVFAEQGYAVLRPNPRGSTGYGRPFREAALGDWGPGPFQDLMAGIDKAVEMGVVHPDSLVIVGPSYGGYLTAYAVTQTDRFEAASVYAGLSNLISSVGTSDLPDHEVGHRGGEFWERPETYEEQSPIYHIEEVSTPTQVLHGTEDERVPLSQGKELYRALDQRGVETEMVIYPRQPHGPREPKQMMDLSSRVLEWFDEHLGRSSADAAGTPSGEQ